MAYRKHLESWLENDCKKWGNNVSLALITANSSDYVWHLTHQHSVYEITYSDLGEISLSSNPKNYWPGSFIREIYHGDNSYSSYRKMIDVLSDNFVDSMV
jgi:hypothetical protein